jgi:hypothetical protein
MKNRRSNLPMTACALAAATFMLVACGGGDAEAPPSLVSNTTDTTAPVMTMTDNVSATTATGDVTFTFTFNEDVGTTFTADDVTVVGGTKGAFSRIGGTSATLVVSPMPNAAGMIEVSVAAARFTDAAGNPNAASSAQQAYNTVVLVASTPLVTFDETTAPTLTGFGGAEDSTVAVDPAGGTNKVAKVVKSATAELWAGTTVSVCANNAIATLPFSATLKTVTARVWAPGVGLPVRMKVEDAADPTKSVETEAATTVANGWQTLSFNFANQAAGTAALNLATTYNKVSVFFNFGQTGAQSGGAKTYYLDDIAFSGSAFTASCGGTTGGGGGSTASITMDETTAPVLTGFGGAEDATIVTDPAGGTNKVAKIVKSATAELWAGTTISTGANQSITTIGFTATSKTITVRVYAPAAGKPVRLKVENAADPTVSVETEATTTVAAGWQTLSFNFATQAAGTAALNLAATYNKISVFPNFGTTGAAGGGGTWYFEDVTFPIASTGGSGGGSGGGTVAGFPVSFDLSSTTYTLTGFGGAEDATVVTDPAGGTNKVAKIVKSATAELWAGTTLSTGANFSVSTIPFSATATTMSLRVYAPASGKPVRLKLENAADPTMSVETEATTTVSGAWETLTFNFAIQASGTAALNLASTYNKASVFPYFGTTGANGGGGTWYFDDLNFVP